MRSGFFRASAIIGLLLAASGAQAGIVADLSTGFDGSGALQVAGGVDAHWTVTAAYDGGGSFTLANAPETKVLGLDGGTTTGGAWMANSSASQWITPNDPSFTDNNAPPGSPPDLLLTYSTTFTTLGSGAIIGKVTVDPRATSDNNLIGYQLTGLVSGVVTDVTVNSGDTPFSGWINLSSIVLPLADTYTLSFEVRNIAQGSGNPTGFRSEAVVATPEPGTIYSAACAVLAGLGYGVRRLRRSRTA